VGYLSEKPAKTMSLDKTCEHFLTHHRCFTSHTPADDFQAMADWCRRSAAAHDRYGSGDVLQAFEAKVAALLGYDAARYCLTGVASQAVALRLACDIKGSDRILTHPTSHLLLNEPPTPVLPLKSRTVHFTSQN
jgi:threonine aldolase